MLVTLSRGKFWKVPSFSYSLLIITFSYYFNNFNLEGNAFEWTMFIFAFEFRLNFSTRFPRILLRILLRIIWRIVIICSLFSTKRTGKMNSHLFFFFCFEQAWWLFSMQQSFHILCTLETYPSKREFISTMYHWWRVMVTLFTTKISTIGKNYRKNDRLLKVVSFYTWLLLARARSIFILVIRHVLKHFNFLIVAIL